MAGAAPPMDRRQQQQEGGVPLTMDSECAESWATYLHALNALCKSGGRLLASMGALAAKTGTDVDYAGLPDAAEWESLDSSLLAATQAAHSHSPFLANQSDRKNVIESVLAVMNQQYRFCTTTCDLLVSLSSPKQQQHEQRLLVAHKSAVVVPDPFKLFPIADEASSRDRAKSGLASCKNVRFNFHLAPPAPPPGASPAAQLRRWSETAAHKMHERQEDPANVRRWSVPWDGGQPPLAEDKNTWHSEKVDRLADENDPLEMAIVLLSHKPESRRSCSLVGPPRNFSIWCGSSGMVPFLQLPE